MDNSSEMEYDRELEAAKATSRCVGSQLPMFTPNDNLDNIKPMTEDKQEDHVTNDKKTVDTYDVDNKISDKLAFGDGLKAIDTDKEEFNELTTPFEAHDLLEQANPNLLTTTTATTSTNEEETIEKSDLLDTSESATVIETIDDVFEELKRMDVLEPLGRAINGNGELIYEFIKQVKTSNVQLYYVS